MLLFVALRRYPVPVAVFILVVFATHYQNTDEDFEEPATPRFLQQVVSALGPVPLSAPATTQVAGKCKVGPKMGVFIDNVGRKTTQKPWKIGNVWVFGALSDGIFKMVSVNAKGETIESRFSATPLLPNTMAAEAQAIWDTAARGGFYSASITECSTVDSERLGASSIAVVAQEKKQATNVEQNKAQEKQAALFGKLGLKAPSELHIVALEMADEHVYTIMFGGTATVFLVIGIVSAICLAKVHKTDNPRQRAESHDSRTAGGGHYSLIGPSSEADKLGENRGDDIGDLDEEDSSATHLDHDEEESHHFWDVLRVIPPREEEMTVAKKIPKEYTFNENLAWYSFAILTVMCLIGTFICSGLAIAAVLGKLSALYHSAWPLFSKVVGLISKHKRHALMGLAGATIVILAASFRDNWSLVAGLMKTKIYMLDVVVPMSLLYYDLYNDIRVLIEFKRNRQYNYFTINLSGIVIASVWGFFQLQSEAEEVFSESADGSTDSKLKHSAKTQARILGFFSLFQCMPLYALIIAFIWLILGNKQEFTSFICGPPGKGKLKPLLLSASLAEGLLEGLCSAAVQAYALVHDKWDPEARLALANSVIISVVSVSQAFANMDSRGKVFRNVAGVQTAEGIAKTSQPAYWLAFIFRLCDVCSRLLSYIFFQEFLHEDVKFHGESIAGPIAFGLDFLIQTSLTYYFTKNPGFKLFYSLPNAMASLAEPLLNNGQPIMTCDVVVYYIVHGLETAAMSAIVWYWKGSDVIREKLGTDSWKYFLFFVWFFANIIMYPLLVVLRLVCAYDSKSYGVKSIWEYDLMKKTKFDKCDLNAYPYIIWNLGANPKGKKITLDASMSTVNEGKEDHGLGDRALFLVQLVASNTSNLIILDIHNNSIESHVAVYLATSLRRNTHLRVLSLWRNHLRDTGAKAIADALTENDKLQVLYISSNDLTWVSVVHFAVLMSMEREPFAKYDIWQDRKDEKGNIMKTGMTWEQMKHHYRSRLTDAQIDKMWESLGEERRYYPEGEDESPTYKALTYKELFHDYKRVSKAGEDLQKFWNGLKPVEERRVDPNPETDDQRLVTKEEYFEKMRRAQPPKTDEQLRADWDRLKEARIDPLCEGLELSRLTREEVVRRYQTYRPLDEKTLRRHWERLQPKEISLRYLNLGEHFNDKEDKNAKEDWDRAFEVLNVLVKIRNMMENKTRKIQVYDQTYDVAGSKKQVVKPDAQTAEEKEEEEKRQEELKKLHHQSTELFDDHTRILEGKYNEVWKKSANNRNYSSEEGRASTLKLSHTRALDEDAEKKDKDVIQEDTAVKPGGFLRCCDSSSGKTASG